MAFQETMQRLGQRTAAFRPGQDLGQWREAIRQFTPNWFAMTMGTGIVAATLGALPFSFPWAPVLAESLWIADIVLYIGFTLMFVSRVVFFSDTIRPMLDHPVQSMFLGAIPMGLIPIVNGLVVFGLHWSAAALTLAQWLWWIDGAMAVCIAVWVPYRMFTQQQHRLEQMTAVWLLPIVAPEVTASSAGVLAPHLPGAVAQVMIGSAYVLWAVSVPLAFSILTIVFLRLALHKLPHRDMAASSWLTLGPIGTGSLGLLLLGQAAPHAFAASSLAVVADTAREFGLLLGLLLWGAGLWWLAIAMAVSLRYWRDGIHFNMGWWGFTFPLGVYTAATCTLYRLTLFLPFAFFGTVLALMLFVFWLVVTGNTLLGLWRGSLFRAPCLASASTAGGR